MKGCTITMPLEEYQKLEKYIKQIDTMDSYIQQIEALKGEIQSLKRGIQSLKDINEELKEDYEYKRDENHFKFMEELWYYSQTGDYIPIKIKEQLEKSKGSGVNLHVDLYSIFCEVRKMFEGRSEKYNQFMEDHNFGIWKDYKNLTTEGPDCILGCKNLEEFREKFLSYFRKDSFRKRHNLPLQKT